MRNKPNPILLLMAGLILLAGVLAPMADATSPAAVPPMSNDVVVSARDKAQYEPAIAYNSMHNEYLVVWRDDEPGTGIYGQRVTSGGQLVGLSPIEIATGPKPRREPDVAYDPVHDRYLVVWMHDHTGSGDWDLSGRFIPWENSSPSEPEFKITDWPGDEHHPKVAYAGGQIPKPEFLVAFNHRRATAPLAWYIAGVRVYADGSGFAPTSLVISQGPENRDHPDVTYNLNRNDFGVVWMVWRGTKWDVEGVRLDGDGTPLGGGEFVVANSSVNDLWPSVAACHTADTYLVVWKTKTFLSDDEIRGRSMDGDGSLANRDIQLDTTKGEEAWADVACNPDAYQYLAVWQEREPSAGSKFGILGSRVDTNDNVLDAPAFEIVSPSLAPVDRTKPAVAGGPQPSYLVAWEHVRQGTAYRDIYGRIVGNTPPRAAFTINPTSGDTNTVFRFDGSGSSDDQDPTSALEVRWDWDNDGTYDTGWDTKKTVDRQFVAMTTHTIGMQVRDTGSMTDSTTRQVTVHPPGAVVKRSVFLPYVAKNW